MKALAVILLLVGSCQVPTSSTQPFKLDQSSDADEIRIWWKLAQEDVACFDHRAASIPPDFFMFQVMPGEFDCAGVRAVGCYYFNTKTIAYSVTEKHVLRHEGAHAILAFLKHDCAHDVGHDTRAECMPCL